MKLEITRIAILLTCYNRKDITIECLKHIKRVDLRIEDLTLDIFITDDGSTDGTSMALKKQFKDVRILEGTGSLYWAGGMRNSWNHALMHNYDAYLLINDDTNLFPDSFKNLIIAHEYSINNYKKAGIYIGSTLDPQTKEFTYGGRVITNKWLFKTQKVYPNGTIQRCDLGNANIMLVHKDVVKSIGIFCDRYIHAKADYDYTLRALKHNIPVLVCAEYCGTCISNSTHNKKPKTTIAERIKELNDPKGIELKGYMYFMWHFFPIRAPFVFISLWINTIFPKYNKLLGYLFKRN